jgi:uncharacterized protein
MAAPFCSTRYRGDQRLAAGSSCQVKTGAGTLRRVNADAVEIRVLGCLIEKQRTTPDVYPLSLNALRLAANQSTNRDPVVDYDEATIRAALDRLGRRRWTRLTSGHGSRAPKFRHLLDEALGLDPAQLALLAVLMLRGPQTPGELKQRSERLHGFADIGAVEDTLDGLIQREVVARLDRRPGQKEERYMQLIGAAEEPGENAAAPPAYAAPASPPAGNGLDERVRRLESEVAELRAALARLRDDLGS